MSVTPSRILLISGDASLQRCFEAAAKHFERSCAALICHPSPGAPLVAAQQQPDLIVIDAQIEPARLAELAGALRELAGERPLLAVGGAAPASDLPHLAAPASPAELAAAIAGIWQRHQAAVFARYLEQLKREYLAELPAAAAELLQSWGELLQGWGRAERERLHRQAHTIRGAAGALGLSQLADAARATETALRELGDQITSHSMPDALAETVERLAATMRRLGSEER